MPDNLRSVLPAGAQDIFNEAFNSAWEQYAAPAKRRGQESRGATAMRVAWAAVKQKYHKAADGNWRAD